VEVLRTGSLSDELVWLLDASNEQYSFLNLKEIFSKNIHMSCYWVGEVRYDEGSGARK
jgi:hypothetical protein